MLERPSKRPRSEGANLNSTSWAPASGSRTVPWTADEEAAGLAIQAAFRGFASRTTGLALLHRERGLSTAASARARAEASVSARLRTAEYRQLARYCKQVDVAKLASFDSKLEALTGLEVLKEYCASVRRDGLARAALHEPPLVRNVLVSGSLGTGKKLAAEMIVALLRALGVAKGMLATQTTLDQLALDVRRDVSCVIVEGLNLQQNAVEPTRAKVDAVLSNFPNHCFIFLGPTVAVEALHGAVPHFRKVEPAWLQLPNYSPPELASIAAAQLSDRGYSLTNGIGVTDLQAALCSTWPRDVLAQRNGHLAAELVQRAISHRSSRLSLAQLLGAPLTLTADDLGLQAHGLQSLLAEREAVDDEVKQLVGMRPLKRFLVELRAKVGFVARGGDPRLLEGCLNVVLTGNPGAGKTTAARLLFRALRAYGLLKKNVFVERNALELKGTHVGWTCPQVKEMVQAALGGCLFLDEAYALSGGSKDGDRGDSFSDEAVRTLLTETENNRTSLCVVLAGYREAMEGLMRADPGLVRRFPTSIHLDDYTPAELAAIARQTARVRFGLRFDDGVEEQLAEYIERMHGHEIQQHNASLAVALVEAAINRLALRLFDGTDIPHAPSASTELDSVHSAEARGADGAGSDGAGGVSTPASMPASPASTAHVPGVQPLMDGVGDGAVASGSQEERMQTLVASDFLISAAPRSGDSPTLVAPSEPRSASASSCGER